MDGIFIPLPQRRSTTLVPSFSVIFIQLSEGTKQTEKPTVGQKNQPKMRDQSAHWDGTAVGVEYILMEKLEGVALYQRYKNLRQEVCKK